jgi:hypothetical protein
MVSQFVVVDNINFERLKLPEKIGTGNSFQDFKMQLCGWGSHTWNNKGVCGTGGTKT